MNSSISAVRDKADLPWDRASSLLRVDVREQPASTAVPSSGIKTLLKPLLIVIALGQMRRVLARLPKGMFATRDNVAGKNQSLEEFIRTSGRGRAPKIQ